MENEYVGICLPLKLYKELPRGDNDKEEKFNLYEDGANLHGINICYFRWKDIQPGQPIIRAYVKSESGYQLCFVKTPEVIFNRTMTTNLKIRRKIKALTREGKHIFNAYIRDRKYFIHGILMRDSTLVSHLPETLIATNDSICYMMNKYDELFIKPTNGSLGMGIMKLEKDNNDQWILTYQTVVEKEIKKVYFKNELPDFLLKAIKNRSYLIQERIHLDTHEGHPFDIRVHVQRDETGDWTITGMLMKVASTHPFLTNAAQGGALYTFNQIIDESRRTEVHQAISKLSLKVAKQLTLNLPHIAEIGLDIGLTKEGVPYFIECNFRPHRYLFNLGNMSNEWRLTYSRPLAYARFLLDKNRSIHHS